jgi:hypothetical protein
MQVHIVEFTIKTENAILFWEKIGWSRRKDTGVVSKEIQQF